MNESSHTNAEESARQIIATYAECVCSGYGCDDCTGDPAVERIARHVRDAERRGALKWLRQFRSEFPDDDCGQADREWFDDLIAKVEESK